MAATREQILERLRSIGDLPTLPIVMQKLNRALEDPNCSAVHIEHILVNDPAIATQILKTVNSPIFSAGMGNIRDLKTAIARIGFKEVKNIALSTSVFNMFNHVESRIFNRQDFWTHCLSTSLAAVQLGRLKKWPTHYPPDELHLAGLVHDIGKIILDAHFTELFEQSISLSMQMKLPLFQAEQVVMQIDHCEVGAILAKDWNLPDVAVAAIKYHHDLAAAPEEYRDIVAVIDMANYIVNTQDLGTGGDFSAPAFGRIGWDLLQLTPDDITQVVGSVAAQSAELSDIL